MALTYVNLQDIVLDLLDMDDSSGSSSGPRARVKQFLNVTGQDIWLAHPWPERFAEATIVTVPPYSTGTVAITGDGTSTTVTLTSGTFPTSISANLTRFGLSYSSPYYLIASRDSGSQITLARNYEEATVTAATYAVWRDVYEVSTAASAIVSVRLHRNGYDGPLAFVPEDRMDEVYFFAGSSGIPQVWAPQPVNSSGTKRIRVWPVPDDNYALTYSYLKTYTDMSADGDECVVPESRRDLLICGALRYGYRLKDEYQKAQVEEAKFAAMLADHWRREKAVHPVRLQLRGWDEPSHLRYPWDPSTLAAPV